MAPIDHHHRSTTKAIQKGFKSRHASKSALRDRSKGKIETERGIRKTPHQQVMSKLDRRNQAKQKRLTNHNEHLKATGVFSGRDGAPRIVAIVPLCANLSTAAAVRSLNLGVDLEVEVPEEGWVRTNVERFKQKVSYIMVKRDLLAALDACRVADYVVFVLSPEEEVDAKGEHLLRAIESQGLSNCFTVVQGLDAVEPPKRRTQTAVSLLSYINHFLPAIEKVFSLDSRQESANLVRSLCTTIPKGISWREQRSWMMVEDVQWLARKSAMTDGATGEVVLTGVVRGRGLNVDRLVTVGDWGDFQIGKITAAPLASKKRNGEVEMEDVDPALLQEPTADQEGLEELAPEEAVMEDASNYPMSIAPSEKKGVLLDDHHYFSDEYEDVAYGAKPKRLPKGTSNYQSAWYLDDVSDSGSDLEDAEEDEDGDLDMEGPANPADGVEGMDPNGPEPTEGAPTTYAQSEMFLDPSPEDEADQLAEYRRTRKDEAEEDLEFPDEIELPPNVLARERLARYRGLKSLRTSNWETDEDKPHEPSEWPRLLEVKDFKGAVKKVLRETSVGGVAPGIRVNVHLKNVPLSFQDSYNPSRTLSMFSLLRHEHKRTSVNYSITLSSSYPVPVKSKTEFVVQCGPRRMVIKPIFSAAGNSPNDVHKFDRYLHPGRNAIASFIGPLTWGSVPALYFERVVPSDPEDLTPQSLNLVATGTSLAPSTNRVVTKRIILTGHPYKIHKKLVTVRYMFFNSEDVAWFKALQLWTKRGRSGFIRESLGTHGYFKATFDGKINPLDAVACSLYKRVWPRSAVQFQE
ncbi:DUF663-domain-containing protein [Lophium mytilinum]|uniref:DUF663-domain-containing protein n=1 Tax=Lophium mytilinum TaxID=390894 RepID=A0A6A6R0V8_9PEZI|nr:DUF663-domain-containing protein [Lophium mytilinum]